MPFFNLFFCSSFMRPTFLTWFFFSHSASRCLSGLFMSWFWRCTCYFFFSPFARQNFKQARLRTSNVNEFFLFVFAPLFSLNAALLVYTMSFPGSRHRKRWTSACDRNFPVPCQKTDHNTGNYMPYSLRQVCGFFYVPQDYEHWRVVRRDLRLIVLIREDLKV